MGVDYLKCREKATSFRLVRLQLWLHDEGPLSLCWYFAVCILPSTFLFQNKNSFQLNLHTVVSHCRFIKNVCGFLLTIKYEISRLFASRSGSSAHGR